MLKFNNQTEEELCFISSDVIIKTLEDYKVQVNVVDTVSVYLLQRNNDPSGVKYL